MFCMLKKKKNTTAHVSKHPKKQVALLMIPNG